MSTWKTAAGLSCPKLRERSNVTGGQLDAAQATAEQYLHVMSQSRSISELFQECR